MKNQEIKVNPQQVFKVNLTINNWSLILDALQQKPMSQVRSLVNTIEQQIESEALKMQECRIKEVLTDENEILNEED